MENKNEIKEENESSRKRQSESQNVTRQFGKYMATMTTEAIATADDGISINVLMLQYVTISSKHKH